MEIDYLCNRCNKIVKAKVTRTGFKKVNYGGKKHNRLDCTECGKYIKFIGKQELFEYTNDEPPEVNGGLDEINFKLDLILDNLGIIQYR